MFSFKSKQSNLQQLAAVVVEGMAQVQKHQDLQVSAPLLKVLKMSGLEPLELLLLPHPLKAPRPRQIGYFLLQKSLKLLEAQQWHLSEDSKEEHFMSTSLA